MNDVFMIFQFHHILHLYVAFLFKFFDSMMFDLFDNTNDPSCFRNVYLNIINLVNTAALSLKFKVICDTTKCPREDLV